MSAVIKNSINRIQKDSLLANFGMDELSLAERAKKVEEAIIHGKNSAESVANYNQTYYQFLNPLKTLRDKEQNYDQNISNIGSKKNNTSIQDPWLDSFKIAKANPSALGSDAVKTTYTSFNSLDNINVNFNFNTEKAKEEKKKEESQIQEMKINPNDIEPGFNPGSHSGDPEGNTTAGTDKRDYGKDRWLENGANEIGKSSLNDKSRFRDGKDEGKEVYRDGQGIAQIADRGSGLDHGNWFKLQTIQGDQFVSLAMSDNSNKSAGELLSERAQDYVKAGIKDGDLIGILIGKGMSAEDFYADNDRGKEERARYERFKQAKSGTYDWVAMKEDLLKSENIMHAQMEVIEKITGMNEKNRNLFTENLFYESYVNIHKMGEDLNYFKDKAQAFNIIWACDPSEDHNGALHMNHGSVSGLAASEQRPTIVLSADNDEDMKRQLFRLMFVPKNAKEKGIDGFTYLKNGLSDIENREMQDVVRMLGNEKLSVEARIEKFYEHLDKYDLEKNVGVGSYMLKGHGWSGGIAMHNGDTYDNRDKDVMALMGLAVSANVDQARVHQQSCSTAQHGDKSNVAVGNNTMNDFVSSSTDIVSVGATEIHWNGQGRHYQYSKSIHGSFVDEGQITEKIYYERHGLRGTDKNGKDYIRDEEYASMNLWTKNADGIVVKREEQQTAQTSSHFSFGQVANNSSDTTKDEKDKDKENKTKFVFS